MSPEDDVSHEDDADVMAEAIHPRTTRRVWITPTRRLPA